MLGRELTRRETVDHKDGDGLNNRRENLRLASYGQNQFAGRQRSKSETSHPGVHFESRRGKWCASITMGGVYHWLGYFETFEEARLVRLKAEEEFYGEFAGREAA